MSMGRDDLCVCGRLGSCGYFKMAAFPKPTLSVGRNHMRECRQKRTGDCVKVAARTGPTLSMGLICSCVCVKLERQCNFEMDAKPISSVSGE
jgi:hypothetical protein